MGRAADPLLAALIRKLPESGTAWSKASRQAWLRMMEMAFDVVYAGDTMSDSALMPVALPDASSDSRPPAAGLGSGKVDHSGYDYYVDAAGFARSDTQKDADGLPRFTPKRRIMPDEIEADETVYDYRRGAARSRDGIIWADDATGAVPGLAFCGPG